MESNLREEPEIIADEKQPVSKDDATLGRSTTPVESTPVESEETSIPVVRTKPIIPKIYLVTENGIPAFWCSSIERARKKILHKLKTYMNSTDKKYYIEETETDYTLVSTNNLFIIQYDEVEAVFEIHTVWRK
jgi:hypothetical protein